MKTPEEVITGALEALGPNGEHWTQGTWGDQYGRMCVVGALRRGAGSRINDEYRHTRNAVDAVLYSEYGITSIVPWNDEKDRQFAEVRAVLEKARVNAVHH
jgi:hypothetical protein